MRIEFDSGNMAEVLAVSALIDALADRVPHGTTLAADAPRGQPDIVEPTVIPVAPAPAPAPEPEADPAAAFGGVDAATAFAGNGAPVAAPAPSDGAIAGAASPIPSPPSPGVQVDKSGLPWDKRIHSDPPTVNKSDGVWRRKRRLDEAVEAQVVAELRQAMGAPAAVPAAPAPVPAPPAAEAAPAVPLPPATDGAPSAPEPAATAPTAAPIAPPPTPVAADTASGPVAAATASSPPAVATFADLMRKITGLQTAGQLTVEGTAEISRALGITGVRDLMHRPDLIPAFDALLPGAA